MKIDREQYDPLLASLLRIDAHLGALTERVQPNIHAEAFSIGASGNNLILPSPASGRMFICGLCISAFAAVNVSIGYTRSTFAAGASSLVSDFHPIARGVRDSANNADEQPTIYLGAGAGIVDASQYPYPLFVVENGSGLVLKLSTAAKVSGYVRYWVA